MRAPLLCWCLCWLFGLGRALAAAPDFAPVTPLAPGQTLRLPADHGAHPAFRTEWWYATAWLDAGDGKPLGLHVTFFRSATGHERANPSAFAPHQLIIGHVALSDPARGALLHDQRSAREGFGLAYAKSGDTDIRLDGWRMWRTPAGSYRIEIGGAEVAVDLTLTPTQPVLLQGQGGYSRKGADPARASYYYSQPQLAVSGKVARGGARALAVTGRAWLDHEWSSQVLDPAATGWDWVGANLADGGALMAFQIRDKTGGKLWAHAVLRDAAGKLTQYATDAVRFTPQTRWRSPRTGVLYPVAMRIETGATVWQVQPLQQDQELDARRTSGTMYWEGAVTLTRDGAAAGHGYLELTGYDKPIKF